MTENEKRDSILNTICEKASNRLIDKKISWKRTISPFSFQPNFVIIVNDTIETEVRIPSDMVEEIYYYGDGERLNTDELACGIVYEINRLEP
jgi:hypothetical protein